MCRLCGPVVVLCVFRTEVKLGVRIVVGPSFERVVLGTVQDTKHVHLVAETLH